LVELEVDNRNGALKAGDYAQVTLNLARSDHALSIPASALIFRAQGLQVATLTAQNHIALKPVQIQRDLGARVELASGLTAGERIVNDPPDSILEGDPVRVADAGTIHGS
ncbi:MAG: efflux RND transporter periplasmic adaptor subunit, partial [Proteobacteria bacterium]|nr:efflux RND transporter periplasmic adaptor subunit [Pseudomonadota bacterium]